MAKGIDNILSTFANPSYLCCFEVQIIPPAGNTELNDFKTNEDLTLYAETATLPGKSLDMISIGGSRYPVKSIPVGYKVEDVNIEFILNDGYRVRDLFEKWIGSIINPGEDINSGNYMIQYEKEYHGTVIIKQLDAHQKPMYEIKLLNAFPKSISSIEFNAANVELSKIQVAFAYSDYQAERISNNTNSAGFEFDTVTEEFLP